MNTEQVKRLNKIAIFEAIINGDNTYSALTAITGLSIPTIELLCTSLAELGLIYRKAEKTNDLGRYPIKYFPVDNHFCAYIEEGKELFSCILVDRACRAVERFDKRKNPIVEKNIILSRFIRDINEYDKGRGLCRGILIDCYDETAPLLTEHFERIKREEFIVNAVKNGKETSLFIFEDKCILNLYGKISTSTSDQSLLKQSLPFDNIYTISKPYYDELFDAISIHIASKMKELI